MAEAKLQTADSGVGADGRPAGPERIPRRPPAVRPQPLAGKSFYLDLPTGKNLQFLMGAIQQLGGVIESFLSREVSCIVSSRREAKTESGNGGPGGSDRGRPSRGKAEPAPQPAPRGRQTRLPPSKPENSVPMSRGKELLQKAIKNQGSGGGGSGGSSSLLSHARSWGVRILHVDDMMTHMQQWSLGGTGSRKQEPKPEGTGPGTETPTPGGSSLKPRSSRACPQSSGRRPLHSPGASGFLLGTAAHLSGNQPVGRLKAPYLKIEDRSRIYRPFQHQFRCFPELTFLGPGRSSPFEPPKAAPTPVKAKDAEGGGGSPCSAGHTAPRKRKGYCECCQVTFEELDGHLRSWQHRCFALDPTHYADVDRLIARLNRGLAELTARPAPPRPASPAPSFPGTPTAEVSIAAPLSPAMSTPALPSPATLITVPSSPEMPTAAPPSPRGPTTRERGGPGPWRRDEREWPGMGRTQHPGVVDTQSRGRGEPSTVAPQEGLVSGASPTPDPPLRGFKRKLQHPLNGAGKRRWTSSTAHPGTPASPSPAPTSSPGLWPPGAPSAPLPCQSGGPRAPANPAPGPPSKEEGPPAPSSGPPAGETGWSESDWDLWLLTELDGLRPSPGRCLDAEGLRHARVALPDGAYASQLDSVLTPRAELDWTGREGEREDAAPAAWHTDPEDAFFSAFTACLGHWAS
ncbi:protein DBF4 homolog B [Tachyglossus aculeatus]|uniref:protein DBF4 homolog B n=1 Tax=Tachyglossus aculeatus TaxID=9261 RepID=UPI0018F34338|nr:protein DBF4 homolog B [Tachyglossus aculeatus]XP_038609748.1 protein DBF4 homolog B [Tachyglossus aculeatus]XP_038609749.1 protein DBF4 homolog B [Tachyglossus aculeatus]XP_038609750.1 protein DBF4 homolog B [Tachyglossus aculeatus]XP_038609751.1 protein DBF4 homolog B [Tachyglossus aculeatus]